jgi:hypothetical protein
MTTGLTVTEYDSPIYDSLVTESYESTPIYDSLIEGLYPLTMVTPGDHFRDISGTMMKITARMNRFGESIQKVMETIEMLRPKMDPDSFSIREHRYRPDFSAGGRFDRQNQWCNSVQDQLTEYVKYNRTHDFILHWETEEP